MQKKNGFVEFHHFMKKERLNKSIKTFLNQWEPMGFCKLQTKKIRGNFHNEIENCLHSSSNYPQESESKTEKGRKSRVKIRATIAS